MVNCRKRETVAVDQLQWQQVFGCGKLRAGRIPGESSKRPAEGAETRKLTIVRTKDLHCSGNKGKLFIYCKLFVQHTILHAGIFI